jgi:hypothetical protein
VPYTAQSTTPSSARGHAAIKILQKWEIINNGPFLVALRERLKDLGPHIFYLSTDLILEFRLCFCCEIAKTFLVTISLLDMSLRGGSKERKVCVGI